MITQTSVLLISLLSAHAFAADAPARVDLTRILQIPVLPGATVQGDVPTEFTSSNEDGSLSVSFSPDGLDLTLQSFSLPLSNEAVTRRLETQRCQISTITRQADFQLQLKDSDYLKSQSLFCRAARILFGACKPQGPADLFAHGQVKIHGEEIRTPQQTEVVDLNPTACARMANAGDSSRYDRFFECAAQAGGDQRSCLDPFAEAKLQEVDHVWVAERQIRYVYRQATSIAPSVVIENGTRRLTSLKIGQQNFDSAWTSNLSYLQAFRAFSAAQGPVKADVTYTTTFPTLVSPNVPNSSTGTPDFNEVVVANYPASVKMQASSILQTAVIEDTLSARPAAEQLLSACQQMPQQGDFARFICQSSGPGLLDLLSKKAQVRIRFLDQNGTARQLTWERSAPIEFCSMSQSIHCELPDNAQSQWIADASDLFSKLKSDPSYANATLTFNAIEHFIPRAAGAAELGAFVVPQTHALVVTK